MKEAVRSGRRANFFITENRFIDHYAAKVGGSGVAVYSILQRCANSETRETWISAAKMAEILAMDKSTVYRYLEQLEELRLIRRVKTREKTIYVVLPVPPPRPEMSSTPLFDEVETKTVESYTWAPVVPMQTSRLSETESHHSYSSVAPMQHPVATAQHVGRDRENRNKEEQDLSNKTQEQDLKGNKTLEQEPPEIIESAEQVLELLKLPVNFRSSAIAVVKADLRQTGLSPNGAAARIATAADLAKRKNIPSDRFLDQLLTQASVQQVIRYLGLPETSNLTHVVTAAVKAEVNYTGLSTREAAASITKAASEDRQKGIAIDKFYFEDAKWRNYGRTGKGGKQFERIKRARDEAHAIIDAEVDH